MAPQSGFSRPRETSRPSPVLTMRARPSWVLTMRARPSWVLTMRARPSWVLTMRARPIALLLAAALTIGAASTDLSSFRDTQDRAGLDRATAAARLALKGKPVPPALERLAGLPAGPVGRVVADAFTVHRSSEILLTGYYEPVLRGRRRSGGAFRYPVYSSPSGPERTRTRAEIDSGALAGKGLELFYVADRIELFFLHIQGSGRLELPDGRVVRLGYAANNGRTYRSIGKVLLERGAFARADDVTAAAIKEYLRGHPDSIDDVLRQNPRYIFFRSLDSALEDGPPGALGAPLVPFRSVAVDPDVVPLGTPGLLRAPLPDGRTLQTVVIAMDTGAAIRGAGRLDLFVGTGSAAGRLAGELRARGRIDWLRPRVSGANR